MAVIHACCDDGLGFTMPRDDDTWLADPANACKHMRKVLDLGHWETRQPDGSWVPCDGHDPIPECEKVGPTDAHRFVLAKA